jgi:BASS family bile acid:Na+ symporter
MPLMLRIKDIVLLIVVFGSMAAGVFWPNETRGLSPFLSWFLMGMLLLAFLKVFPSEIWDTLQRYSVKLPLLILTKLTVIPLLIYPIAIKLLPAYALGIILLAGVSTGLSAPFFSGYVGANISLVLAMTVVTTLLLPLTLPLLIKILIGRELQFDLIGLVWFMTVLIFFPLMVSVSLRRLAPKIAGWLDERSYPISLVLLAAMNLGALGLYAPFLRAHHAVAVISVLIGFGLGAVLAGAGMVLFWSNPPLERVAAAGALGWVNSVLVIVLGNYFGDPLTSILAAFYMVPYYVLIIPLGHLSQRCGRSGRFTKNPDVM